MGDDSSGKTSVTLLERLRRDACDQQAWERFVDKYGSMIYFWCRRWGLQEADADEVTQDVLIRLTKHLRKFEYRPAKGQFRGWLHQVAKRVWHDFVEHRKRPDRGSGSSAALEELESIPAREDFAQVLEKVYDLEFFDMAQARVRQRVAPHTWEAFSLVKFHGLGAEEAANRLHIKIGTVHQAVFKVTNMLKEEIERLQSREHSS